MFTIAVEENGDHLCYYGERSGNYVPAFRNYQSDPSPRVNKLKYWTLQSESINLGLKLDVRTDWIVSKLSKKLAIIAKCPEKMIKC